MNIKLKFWVLALTPPPTLKKDAICKRYAIYIHCLFTISNKLKFHLYSLKYKSFLFTKEAKIFHCALKIKNINTRKYI